MPKSPLITSIQKTLAELNIMPSRRLLVGVSGGADSMVLLMALKELGYAPTAAHVNFQLRGKDSDDDASFVTQWCSDHSIPYLENRTDTEAYATRHQLNTQSAAREIRYDWWKSLMESGNFDFVATAHHRDDSIETLFLNLLRGTGIKGLKGIPVQREYFIRPLLGVSRSQIESFALDRKLSYRTDKSNDSDAYQRNRVRHHLIPLLHDLNPDLDAVMGHTLLRIGLEWKAWEAAYQHWIRDNIIENQGGFDLRADKPEYSFLLKWLEEKDIPWTLAYDFISSVQANTGRTLDHRGYSLSRTKVGFYLEKIEKLASILIPSPGIFQIDDCELSIVHVPSGEFEINIDPWTEYADLGNITWPLELRSVRTGDHFQPLGMSGQTRKLQDYLVDQKLDHHQKKQIRILTSSDQILWVVGMRLDERIRIKPGSTEIFRLSYKQH